MYKLKGAIHMKQEVKNTLNAIAKEVAIEILILIGERIVDVGKVLKKSKEIEEVTSYYTHMADN